jgi:hypothetical protein
MKSRQESIAQYMEYVESIISEFARSQDIIQNGDVSPERVNACMANFFIVSSALCAEYQRKKIEYEVLAREYGAWHDQKLDEARTALIETYKEELAVAEKTKSKGTLVKPSVAEYGVQLRLDNAEEYERRKSELDEAEARMRFMLRMMDNLDKQFSLLQTISSNMRTEMKQLSVDAAMSTIGAETLSRRTRRV